MKRRIGTVAVGLAAVVALIVVPAAMAAFTIAEARRCTQAGPATTSRRRSSPTTIRRRAVRSSPRPARRSPRRRRPGPCSAQCDGDREGARPRRCRPTARGQLDRRGPGSDPRRVRSSVHRPRRRAARDVGHGAVGIAGQRSPCRSYLADDSGALAALGPAYHRDLPSATLLPVLNPGRAPSGATGRTTPSSRSRVSSRRLLRRVRGDPQLPYTRGTGTRNAAGTGHALQRRSRLVR